MYEPAITPAIKEGEKTFEANLLMKKKPINSKSLTRALLKYPLITWKIKAAIYYQAFENIDQASITKICQIQGIGAAKAAQIKAALEVGKRMAAKTSGKNKDEIQSGFLRIFFTLFEKAEKGNSKYHTS